MVWTREGRWIDILCDQSAGGVDDADGGLRPAPVRRSPRGERAQNFVVVNQAASATIVHTGRPKRDKLRKHP